MALRAPRIQVVATTTVYLITFANHTTGKCYELYWSTQHLREVYSRESRNLRFCADLDLDAARSCRGLIAHSVLNTRDENTAYS
jgi:hypothetical protein